MAEEKKYTKLKIFLFFIFGVFAVVLITDLIRLTDTGITNINKNNDNLKCIGLNYEIKDTHYDGNRLRFEIRSRDYDTEISSISIIPDGENKTFTQTISPLNGGESQIVQFQNITLNSSFSIYAGSCSNNLKTENVNQ